MRDLWPRIFRAFDKNKNGFVTQAEVILTSPRLKQCRNLLIQNQIQHVQKNCDATMLVKMMNMSDTDEVCLMSASELCRVIKLIGRKYAE